MTSSLIETRVRTLANTAALMASLFASAAVADASAGAERAAQFESARLLALVKNLRPSPHWIGGTDRFWLRSETPEGVRFIVVDASSGRQSPAFDHGAMAKALAAAGLVEVHANALPVISIDLRGESIRVSTAKGGFVCAADASSCEKGNAAGSSAAEKPSPDGKQILFVRDHNLWLRDAGGGRQRPVTDDGTEGFAYGSLGVELSRVERRRRHQPTALMSASWSPDGRYIAAMRVDLRNVPLRPVVTEHLPPDDTFAVTHLDRVIVAADRIAPTRKITVVDTRTGKSVSSDVDPAKLHDFAPLHFASNHLWWNLKDGELFFVTADHGGQTYGIAGMNLATGATRAVIEESGEHYFAFNARDYNRPNFHVTSEGKDAIFYSQRSGAGHLYRYDASSGKLRNAITKGSWSVFDLIRVDEKNRQVYFTAGGREPGRNPYYPHLYRVSFDGGGLELLTPEDGVHEFHTSGLPIVASGSAQSQFSPSGKYFVDVFSTLERPPVMVVRTARGQLVSQVMKADISALAVTGWQPPERFIVKAADGVTDLYGAMFRPIQFDPGLSYAVVDQTYPGPQTNSAPHSFIDNFAAMTTYNAQATAEAGLIVVALDGRGTTRRDRAFRYAFAGSRDIFGAADHKAAIENLAKRFAYLDPTRVGITGASFGGHGSLRAALLYPDFFDAVVSHVGPHESLSSAASTISAERFLGVPGSGRDYYEATSNIAIIDKLQADLMLVYGEIDENVPLRAAMTIYDALMKADKDFTTYVVPNADHLGAFHNRYIVERERRFFLEHLGGPKRQAGQGDDRETARAIIADVDAWILERDLVLRQRRGLPITKLPGTSLADINATADYAREILARIQSVNSSAIDHQSLVDLQVITNRFETLAAAPEHYWLQFDVTPYARGFALYTVNPVWAGLPLATAEQRKLYVGLVDDYVKIIEEWSRKTAGQVERGILIPKAALPGVRATLAAEKDSVAGLLLPQSSRLKGVDASVAEDFLAAVVARIEDRVEPAYDAILSILDEDYEKRAPNKVGMNQYPGGAAAYRAAVRQAASYDVSPEELHASGLAALESLHAKMKTIRDELGFEGSAMQFNDRLRTDPRFIAKSPADVEARYTQYLRQIEPLIDGYFRVKPEAPYGVKRLDPAQEAGHAFGCYQMPSATEPRGLYYNGSQLAERSMVSAQSLIYHELIPGHHFQIALHAQMKELPIFMQSFDFIMLTAYTEGWAEYASSLGMEMGLYDDPYERYDRYLKEAILATRLVVDTGMNLFGWSLEQARQFMRVNTIRSETEIASETLRYSTDIPAQALGYRYGADFIWRLRHDKEAKLGDAFDVKDFHAAVLGAGILPMWVLEKHVQWYFDRAVAADRAP